MDGANGSQWSVGISVGGMFLMVGGRCFSQYMVDGRWWVVCGRWLVRCRWLFTTPMFG